MAFLRLILFFWVYFLISIFDSRGSVGPVVAEAMFVNREEIPVYPIYRDPVSELSLVSFWILSLLDRFHFFSFFLFKC